MASQVAIRNVMLCVKVCKCECVDLCMCESVNMTYKRVYCFDSSKPPPHDSGTHQGQNHCHNNHDIPSQQTPCRRQHACVHSKHCPQLLRLNRHSIATSVDRYHHINNNTCTSSTPTTSSTTTATQSTPTMNHHSHHTHHNNPTK